MFYAHFVLSKKGPLARIWLAAHWDRKLTKAHVFETNIERSVEGILQPKVKMALRTSGHLLLGVVRIYSRKAKYLLADCNEAFIKIKMAFRPGVVDLPEENREAALNAITLPEVFHDFDTPFQETNNESEGQSQFTLNQSRAEEITLREDYASIAFAGDDGFGDMGFEDGEIVRHGSTLERDFGGGAGGRLFGDEDMDTDGVDNDKGGPSARPDVPPNHSISLERRPPTGVDAPLRHDDFGGDIGEGLFSAETGGLFEPGGLFDDAPNDAVQMDTSVEPFRAISAEPAAIQPLVDSRKDVDSDEDDYYDMGPASMGAPSSGRSSPVSPVPPLAAGTSAITSTATAVGEEVDENGPLVEFEAIGPNSEGAQVPAGEQTTLIQNEEETFALAPLEATIIVQGGEKGKAKRKRKLIIDEVKNISGEEMKLQMTDVSDIVTGLDLAPPTKQLMHWKETGGVEKLFALSAKPRISKTLVKLYQRHLTTRATPNEDAGLCPNDDRIDLENENRQPELSPAPEPEPQRQPSVSGIKRKLDVCDNDLPPAKVPSLSEPDDAQHQQHQQHQLDLSHLMSDDPLPNLEDCSAHLPSTGDPGATPLHSSTDHHQLPLPQPTTDTFLAAAATASPRPTYDDRLQPPQQMNGDTQRHRGPDLDDALVVDEQDDMPPQLSIMEEDGPDQLMSNADKSLLHLDEDGGFPSLADSEQFFSGPHQPQTPAARQAPSPLPGHDRPGPSGESGATASEAHDHLDASVSPSIHNQQPPTPYLPDDCNDADGPASVGPPDEQGEDETYEQFEERVLNKRAQQMLHVIQRLFARGQERISFSELSRHLMRKQVAQKFYTFLVLKKQQAVELEQEAAFSELYISKGPKLDMLS